MNGDRAKRAKLVGAGDNIRLRNGPLEWQLVVTDIDPERVRSTIAAQASTALGMPVTLQAADVIPLALGEQWTAMHLMETVLPAREAGRT